MILVGNTSLGAGQRAEIVGLICRHPASGFGVGVRVGLGGLPDVPAPNQRKPWEP